MMKGFFLYSSLEICIRVDKKYQNLLLYSFVRFLNSLIYKMLNTFSMSMGVFWWYCQIGIRSISP